MKVFCEANFLVAAGFAPAGDYHRVLVTGTDTFVCSEHVLAEVTRNLQRLGREPESFIIRLRQIMTITDRFEVLPAGLPVQGSGDRQALAEAIGAECEMFITSDTDFADLFGQRVKGVLIEKSGAYARHVLSGLSK